MKLFTVPHVSYEIKVFANDSACSSLLTRKTKSQSKFIKRYFSSLISKEMFFVLIPKNDKMLSLISLLIVPLSLSEYFVI